MDDAKAAHAERPSWAKVDGKLFQELVHKHALAVGDLTEKQLAEAIRQAIACGDFRRYVATTGDGAQAQQVIYIPFAEQARLQARIRELEEQLGVCRECGANCRCVYCGKY